MIVTSLLHSMENNKMLHLLVVYFCLACLSYVQVQHFLLCDSLENSKNDFFFSVEMLLVF